MCHLMGNDLIEHRLRSEDQAPAEGEVSPSRAAAPPAPRVAHIDLRHLAPDARGQPARPRIDLGPRRPSEMIAHPARQIPRITAHPDFTVDDSDRWCGRVGFATD